MKISRRDFLKVTAATGAMAAGGMPALNAFAMGARQKISGVSPGSWLPSTCQGCTAWCPVELFVQEERVVKVRGNRFSKANSGITCPRGHMIIQQMYDPDRVKVPMKRTNPRKGRGTDPRLAPITWDEALSTPAG